MAGHVEVQWRFDASFQAREADLLPASTRRWQAAERRVAIVGFLVRRKDWMTVEEAQANRRRTLLEDNPASG